jgi:hypothetical protein
MFASLFPQVGGELAMGEKQVLTYPQAAPEHLRITICCHNLCRFRILIEGCPFSALPAMQDPQFRGRRVVTFHNQRDFIFVR